MCADVADRITGEAFAEWYREREWDRNIREGRAFFNGPSPVPPPENHAPSRLLQCHRKVCYRQENAPAERPPPEGLFWVGRRFEEDLAVPFLRDLVREDEYVRNSIWVNFEVDTDSGPVRVRGATDPCIVDRQSTPLLPTEIKTKDDVDGVSEPDRHHRAQVHAYMAGLSEDFDREVREAVIVYGGRKHLNVRTFHVPFDPAFWEEIVEWAARHTQYRTQDELPPADPEYDWECGLCAYRHRCGRTDRPFEDEGPRGFLPMVADYPRGQVLEYLRAHDDATLTPALAREYPDLAGRYDVRSWSCPRCERRYDGDEADWGERSGSPVCPECADAGRLVTLTVPQPGGLD